MSQNLTTLPEGLPIPADDGACDHLVNLALPPIALSATTGGVMDLSALHNTVLFGYPRTGVPGKSTGPEWDAIPGARGCTPQSCGFRDLKDEFDALGIRVVALSTQTTPFQSEFAGRNNFPFPMLSDSQLTLTRALGLPTFEFDITGFGGGGPNTLLKRTAWFIVRGTVRRVWYPVFPPDKSAQDVLDWLGQNLTRSPLAKPPHV